MTMPPPNRKLGRKHAKRAPALRLGSILTEVPEHPPKADHLTGVNDWGLWNNDLYGTCGPVSFYNYLKLITHALTGVEAQPTWEEILRLYQLCNPEFDPTTGRGDNGVDMQTMLELAREYDVLGGGRLLAFARVDLDDASEVRAAISIFGGVLLGVTLDYAQNTQTDAGLWDYVRRSPVWGGHAVLAGMYDSDVEPGHSDVEVITWGDRIGTTHSFQQHQLDEAWVVILRDHLDSPGFQKGVDLPALALAFTALTGEPFPETPPVEPPSEEFARFLAWLPAAWEKFRSTP